MNVNSFRDRVSEYLNAALDEAEFEGMQLEILTKHLADEATRALLDTMLDEEENDDAVEPNDA